MHRDSWHAWVKLWGVSTISAGNYQFRVASVRHWVMPRSRNKNLWISWSWTVALNSKKGENENGISDGEWGTGSALAQWSATSRRRSWFGKWIGQPSTQRHQVFSPCLLPRKDICCIGQSFLYVQLQLRNHSMSHTTQICTDKRSDSWVQVVTGCRSIAISTVHGFWKSRVFKRWDKFLFRWTPWVEFYRLSSRTVTQQWHFFTNVDELRSAFTTSKKRIRKAEWTRRTSRWNHWEHDENCYKSIMVSPGKIKWKCASVAEVSFLQGGLGQGSSTTRFIRWRWRMGQLEVLISQQDAVAILAQDIWAFPMPRRVPAGWIQVLRSPRPNLSSSLRQRSAVRRSQATWRPVPTKGKGRIEDCKQATHCRDRRFPSQTSTQTSSWRQRRQFRGSNGGDWRRGSHSCRSEGGFRQSTCAGSVASSARSDCTHRSFFGPFQEEDGGIECRGFEIRTVWAGWRFCRPKPRHRTNQSTGGDSFVESKDRRPTCKKQFWQTTHTRWQGCATSWVAATSWSTVTMPFFHGVQHSPAMKMSTWGYRGVKVGEAQALQSRQRLERSTQIDVSSDEEPQVRPNCGRHVVARRCVEEGVPSTVPAKQHRFYWHSVGDSCFRVQMLSTLWSTFGTRPRFGIHHSQRWQRCRRGGGWKMPHTAHTAGFCSCIRGFGKGIWSNRFFSDATDSDEEVERRTTLDEDSCSDIVSLIGFVSRRHESTHLTVMMSVWGECGKRCSATVCFQGSEQQHWSRL